MNKGKKLINSIAKRAGYVRGFIPELLDRTSTYYPDKPSISTKGYGGKLAMLGLLAAGGYYLWNKLHGNKEKEKTVDDVLYSEVPDSVMSKSQGNRKHSVNYDGYDWDPETKFNSMAFDTDYESVPLEVLAKNTGFKLTGQGYEPTDSSDRQTVVIKSSSANVKSIKNWLYS